MDLKSSMMQLLFRPRKVHALPGRLRVHLPFLLRLDRSRNDLFEMVSSLLTVPGEIESAEISTATGNVLIRYEQERIAEQEVMHYLRGLLELFLNNRDRFQNLPPEKIPALTAQLREMVRRSLGRRLALDTKMEIPHDVLA